MKILALSLSLLTLSSPARGDEDWTQKTIYEKFKPYLTSYSQKNPPKGVKKAKLRHGLYKCDAKGGYGYRLDFFF